MKDHAARLYAGRAGFRIGRGDMNKHSDAGASPEIHRLDAPHSDLESMKLPDQQKTKHGQDVVEIAGDNDCHNA